MELRICDECVDECHLKALIANSKVIANACTYCGKQKATISIDELAKNADEMIDAFYEPVPEPEYSVFDNTQEGESLIDVLQSEIGLSDKAAIDLANALGSSWFDYESMQNKNGEDPHFFPRHSFEEPLSQSWQEMERSLRQEARLVNPTVARVLEEVFGEIHADFADDGSRVITEIPLNTIFYRARVFQTIDSLETALVHPERNIGPPPTGVATAGRMNSRGVSVFYGSTANGVAVAEVRPPVGSHVAVGAFRSLRALRLLDVERLGSKAVQGSSFDPETTRQLRRRDFLAVLTRRMVMPVMPELEAEGYLTTQAIADYLATNAKLNLDGILFPSAQTDGQKGQNVILFNRASKVLRSEAKYAAGSHAYVLQTDSDGTRFEPEIWTNEDDTTPTTTPPPWFAMEHRQEPTLELDRNVIEIFEIKGVVYNTFSHQVKNTLVPSRSAKT